MKLILKTDGWFEVILMYVISTFAGFGTTLCIWHLTDSIGISLMFGYMFSTLTGILLTTLFKQAMGGEKNGISRNKK